MNSQVENQPQDAAFGIESAVKLMTVSLVALFLAFLATLFWLDDVEHLRNDPASTNLTVDAKDLPQTFVDRRQEFLARRAEALESDFRLRKKYVNRRQRTTMEQAWPDDPDVAIRDRKEQLENTIAQLGKKADQAPQGSIQASLLDQLRDLERSQ